MKPTNNEPSLGGHIVNPITINMIETDHQYNQNPADSCADYTEDKDRFAADKADYIHENLDREKWSNMLDKEMFEQFLEFYNENIPG